MPPVVLALGFDLFFKPKMSAAAEKVGVEVRFARPQEAVEKSVDAVRLVADVSAPGVAEALEAVHRARPDLPIMGCYPHVEVARAEFLKSLGAVAVPRGTFAARLEDALAGR